MAGFVQYKCVLYFNFSSNKSDIRDLKHVRRQRDDDSQNKLLQINYCEEELLCIIHCMHVYMNWVQFQEIKTKALWLKTLLLSKFVVSLVASWHVCVVHETWKSLVCRCKHNVSNSRGAFNYSFLLYEIRNIIVWIAVVVALPSCLLKVPINFVDSKETVRIRS
jgi:hypothetical protein